MEDCIFCKIGKKEIPANILYEDEDVVAFYDIDPKAPVHFLVVPKTHYASIMEVPQGDYMGKIIAVIQKIVRDKGMDKQGFRIVVNTGNVGGQTVDHLHFHVLGGRNLGWPPG